MCAEFFPYKLIKFFIIHILNITHFTVVTLRGY